MNDKNNGTIERIGQQATKVLGTDINPISLEDRVNRTPINDVEWSGLRGQSFCRPTSASMKRTLKKYKVDGISYSLNCEPDFDKVAIVKVKISDMTENLQHDRRSTIKKILKTDWAKKKKISTVSDMELYIRNHNLTIHESPDGVSEYLIEEKIHSFFKHDGGRGKYRKFENPEHERIVQTRISQGIVVVNKTTVKFVETIEESIDNTKDYISEQTSRFMSENFKEIHTAGVDEAVNSALFAAAFSTARNTISVINGKENAKDAIKEIVYDTASAAVLGYATGVVKETLNFGNVGDAALLVNGTVQISKQVISYVNGNIDEQQLLNNIAETTVQLAAAQVGRIIGSQLIPIPIVGPYIGEMITTAICSEIISTIKATKEFEKQNQKYISLYHRAEREIRASNERLTSIIETENDELRAIIQEGFQNIYNGINDNSYDLITKGLEIIGSKFGISEEELKKDNVTRENLFKYKDKVIVIGEGE